jgi:hypothetical protein
MDRRNRPLLAAGSVALLVCSGWLLADRLEDTFFIPLDHPAIQYADQTLPPDDAVARLEQRLDAGKTRLDYRPGGGYLASVLKELNVPIDSQVLVFSRTSIEAKHISPRAPRALYFNDEVSVGYVQGGAVLEFTALDPRQGVKLYALDADKADKPSLGRRDECLQCHQGPVTLGVPGLLVSSVHPATGRPGEEHGNAFMTDHRTPFAQRWGGWYVTGTHGAQYHLGNNIDLADPIHPGKNSSDGTQNLTSLADKFDTSKYLAPTSDIVALMVLEHQVRMTNLIIRIGWDVRIAEHDKTLPAAAPQLNAEIEELTAYMLFGDEDQLKEPVKGVSTFTKTFAERGPRDPQGRSLRDFDLKTRLFRYPLSYMIYSAAFDALPDYARERVYRLLYDILTGQDNRESIADLSLAHLSKQDRQAILEIVRTTKPHLPAFWNSASAQ